MTFFSIFHQYFHQCSWTSLQHNVREATSRSATANTCTDSNCPRTWLFDVDFYPRDAILARVLASYGPVSVSVCLSQVGVPSKRLNESGWFLARELPLTYPTLCCKEIQVSSKIRVLHAETLLETLDLENFATAYRIVERAINLARQRWTISHLSKLIIPPSSDAQPL